MSLSLYTVRLAVEDPLRLLIVVLQIISERFQFDGKLDYLIRAMEEVFGCIIQSSLAAETVRKQHIIRLLQQTTECCLFIYQYSQHKAEGERNGLLLCLKRHLTISSDRSKLDKTIAEFISFFVSYNDALASGSNAGPTFVSSRIIRAIDEPGAHKLSSFIDLILNITFSTATTACS